LNGFGPTIAQPGCQQILPTPESEMAHESTQTAAAPAWILSLRSVAVAVLQMSLLWLGFGIVVGAASALPDGDAIRIVSGIIAGMIVLPVIGALLGLIGGRWRETLIGGGAGLIVALGLGLATGQSALFAVTNVGLVSGAIVGATFLSFINHFRRAFRSGVAHRP
jgi:hypothetical protein